MTAEQINAVVEEIRQRVRGRHEKKVPEFPGFELPSLDPLGHARDAAEGKVGSIGTVNPRPPGLFNDAIQRMKRGVARLLSWFVRDQVDFNQAVLRYMDANLEASIEQNHGLLRVGSTIGELRQQAEDLLCHWHEWRPAWEEKLTKSEIELLHTIRGIEERVREHASGQRQALLKMHEDYSDALKQSVDQIQQNFWAELEKHQQHFWAALAKHKDEQEKLIHTELRLIRQRMSMEREPVKDTASPSAPGEGQSAFQDRLGASNGAPAIASFDYARFEERFRGGEGYVLESQRFYLPYFNNCAKVIDLGCGRGEFLHLLKENGITAVGVDSSPDALAACREKNLEVYERDLFSFLSDQAPASAGGVLCSHVVEHLPPESLPGLVRLVSEILAPGGVFAVETPNPGCLAIFAGDFYLDPTHRRPVPSQQLDFYFQEAGLTQIEIHERNPASEVFPEIAAMDRLEETRGFRRKFFGGLDYAIIGRKRQP